MEYLTQLYADNKKQASISSTFVKASFPLKSPLAIPILDPVEIRQIPFIVLMIKNINGNSCST
ncbi:MAG: hypothetical protein H0U57_14035 [Tatlockia sp.]|nr:hypothetical protein [Tatlockia sp.]